MILIGLILVLLAFLGVPLFALFGAAALALFLSLPEGTLGSSGDRRVQREFAEHLR